MATNRQLDIWTELLYQEIDKCNESLSEIDANESPYKYGYAKGIAEGLAMAMTWLSIVEEGKRFKNRIAEIEKKLDAEKQIKEK